MLSLVYRKYAFKLSLVGTDSVVLAYNELMQFFYNQEEITAPTEDKLKAMMRLLGTFLLRSHRQEFRLPRNPHLPVFPLQDLRSQVAESQ